MAEESGWSNEETAAVADHIHDSDHLQDAWYGTALDLLAESGGDRDLAVLWLADRLRCRFSTDAAIQIDEGIWDVLLRRAVSRVDWAQLAASLLDPDAIGPFFDDEEISGTA